jgi:PAS domain S-box-containing protein
VPIPSRALDVCLWLAETLSRTRDVDDICEAALDGLTRGLDVSRASILLFDADDVMRFKAARGISDEYRRVVEGHSPWRPTTVGAEPIVVADVRTDDSLAAYRGVILREGIAAMAFIPLVNRDRVVGKFMLYFNEPRTMADDEIRMARIIASHIAFAVDRTRSREIAERSEEQLRFALDAASMGTWEWNLATDAVRWSDNLARLHGLERGAFAGTFEAFEREIHPDDRSRVLAAARRAVDTGARYEVEYRIQPPGGVLRWVEGKGRVEYDDDGRPVRLAGVCVDVTRRKRAELARLEAAEESSRHKDEFLAMLSHELRTPLSAIVGWLQVIRTGGLSPDRVSHAMAVIERNAQLQAQIIDQILDVSRIITGKLRLTRTPVLLPKVITQVVHTFEPAAAAKSLRLSHDVPARLPPIEGDAERLQQVLGNLLSNACKFTPPGGDVHLAARAIDTGVEIEVTDTGCGIPNEFLPFVFERFRQADASMTRHHGGLGLGLAIAHHLVELHGGTLQAESGGSNQGSTFRIRLPAARLDSLVVRPSRQPDAKSAEAVRRALTGRRVLVVDDEEDARLLLATMFADQGSVVYQAHSAEEALQRLQDDAFEVLIADIAMPRVDGYELIRRVRRAGPPLRAVAVTAYARPEDRARALAAGYDAFHSKPFDVSALLRTVTELCS